MCWIEKAPVWMLCGHSAPEQEDEFRECHAIPCMTGGAPEETWPEGDTLEYPCDECIDDRRWVMRNNKWYRSSR